jgi:integrase
MTGLRQGELLGLRWLDVDWTASRVRVAESYTRGVFDAPKSHRGRSVPMADRLAGELERHFQRSRWRAERDLVLAHPLTGNVLDASKLRKRFRIAVAHGGIEDLTFHELRHTFGTQMAAAGAPLRAIQEWMGHADASTTEIYAHYAPDPSGARASPSARSAPIRRRHQPPRWRRSCSHASTSLRKKRRCLPMLIDGNGA